MGEQEKVDWSSLVGAIDSDKTSMELEDEMWKKVD